MLPGRYSREDLVKMKSIPGTLMWIKANEKKINRYEQEILASAFNDSMEKEAAPTTPVKPMPLIDRLADEAGVIMTRAAKRKAAIVGGNIATGALAVRNAKKFGGNAAKGAGIGALAGAGASTIHGTIKYKDPLAGVIIKGGDGIGYGALVGSEIGKHIDKKQLAKRIQARKDKTLKTTMVALPVAGGLYGMHKGNQKLKTQRNEEE